MADNARREYETPKVMHDAPYFHLTVLRARWRG